MEIEEAEDHSVKAVSVEKPRPKVASPFWKRSVREKVIKRWRKKKSSEGLETSPFLVGRHEDLSRILGKILRPADEIPYIVISGMAGVGKTALLKAAAKSLPPIVDLVIWATVGRPLNVHKIQDEIGSQLGLSFPSGMSEIERGEKLRARFADLTTKKPAKRYLLVLDDIPSGVGIGSFPYRIGVPGSTKIVFISRYANEFLDVRPICWRFEMIRFLEMEESWELFRRELGTEEAVDDPSIRPLADTLVAKCGGLPLMLIIVAKAMAKATTASQWEHAVEVLYESPGRLPGMTEFLLALKSDHFDRLADETTRQCLLFCSLFPEDDRGISEDELGQLWVASGLVSENSSSSMHVVSHIISALTDECLLIWDGYRRVKMHSTVRLMAYWLTSGDGPYSFNHTEISLAGHAAWRSEHDSKDPIESWRDAKRFLLMCNTEMREEYCCLPGDRMPEFPHLLTLLLTNSKCSYLFLRDVFVRTPALRFLNLSGANIVGDQLPAEIGLLVNLEHLNLSRTSIRELPTTLGRLIKLRHLYLRETRRLSLIPPGTIECLRQLRTLDLYQSCKIDFLSELALCLPAVETLGLSVEDVDWVEPLINPAGLLGSGQFLYSVPRQGAHRRFINRIRYLELSSIPGLTTKRLSAALLRLEGLRELSIIVHPSAESQEYLLALESLPSSLSVLRLSCLQQITRNVKANCLGDLLELHIDNCHGFQELTWIAQLHSLKYISVADCNGLEELIGSQSVVKLGHLTKMSLCRLPRLRSICSILPCLMELEVRECPELTLLSFVARAPYDIRGYLMRKIVGEQEWWDKLELLWEWLDGEGQQRKRGDVKDTFHCYFHPLDPPTGKEGVESLDKSVVSLSKKSKGKLEEIEILHPREEGELVIGQESSCEESNSDEAGIQEADYLTASQQEPATRLMRVTVGEAMERPHKDKDPTMYEQAAENPQESAVSLSKIKGKEKLEEGEGPRRDRTVGLQEGEDPGSEGTVCTAQTHMGDGGILRRSTDSFVDAECQKKILSTIQELLLNDVIGVIGIHGMNGIGKTTLMKRFADEFCSKQNSTFDVVIMVTASKYLHKKKMQKEIGEKLGLSLLSYGPSFLDDMQAAILRQALSQKKFLLILDGVLEMNWDEIGIPLSDKIHKSKIIFATDVCKDMKNIEMIKMSSLNEHESWELFFRNVQGETVIEDKTIKPLAKQVAAKCDGLPLALITVGRAMANKKIKEDWQEAIDKLNDLARDFQGRDQVMHHSLMFSYDYLKDDALRYCLLYCSLFPMNHNINIEELLQYWFGEGIFHDADIDTADNIGHTVIEQLKAAYLLEDGSDKENEVKMHVAVWEFAVKLASSAGEESNMFLVHCGRGLTHALEVEKWKFATKISLMHNELETWPCKMPKCPQLSTLLINNNSSLNQVPKNLFNHTPSLCVLDLSSTGIEELPHAIGLLSKLRFLSLSNTYIKYIPKEVGKLVQLRYLDLSYMSNLSNIPQKAI